MTFTPLMDLNSLSDAMNGERSIKNEPTEKRRRPKFAFSLSNHNCIAFTSTTRSITVGFLPFHFLEDDPPDGEEDLDYDPET
jgi:hypothetical protein